MFEANFLKMENCNPGPTYSRAPQHTASAYSHLSWEKKKKSQKKQHRTLFFQELLLSAIQIVRSCLQTKFLL